jgi:hypothetical protein
VEANGPSGSTVDYGVVTATDNRDGTLVASCSPASGARFPLGSTTVACTARDSAGNASTSHFSIVVRDTTPPVLSVPGDTAVVAASPLSSTHEQIAAFLRAAVARDIVDQSVEVTNDAPALFGYQVQTVVTFTAKDDAGNVARRSAALWVGPPGSGPAASSAGRFLPANVSGVKVAVGDRRVSLSWRPVGAADHYVVLRSAPGSPEQSVSKGKQTRFVDRDLKNGVQYRYVIVTYDSAGNRSAGVALSAVPRVLLLLRPQDGSTVATRRPTFRWVPARRATFYNVQLYRESTVRGRQTLTKVLSIWPDRARYALPVRWTYGGSQRALGPGRYHWYVWPGFGSRQKPRYGALMGHAVFVVART